MKRKQIKDLLLEQYSVDMTNSVLAGRRRPKLEFIIEAEEKLKVPPAAWLNIKQYLELQ
jgi:hypothetical protein